MRTLQPRPDSAEEGGQAQPEKTPFPSLASLSLSLHTSDEARCLSSGVGNLVALTRTPTCRGSGIMARRRGMAASGTVPWPPGYAPAWAGLARRSESPIWPRARRPQGPGFATGTGRARSLPRPQAAPTLWPLRPVPPTGIAVPAHPALARALYLPHPHPIPAREQGARHLVHSRTSALN